MPRLPHEPRPEGDAPACDHATARLLIDTAWRAIEQGARSGTPLEPDPDDYPPALREPRATFVTLRQQGELRGCVGSLEATRPLVQDVAHSAFSAAFRDGRFSPVEVGEIPGLALHISLLSPVEPLTIEHEADLLAKLRPGVDGLLL